MVIVRCTRATFEHVGWKYEPTSMTAAQMNLSFGIAAMIEYGEAFVDQYTEKTIRSPRLIDLTQKVSAVHEPGFDALGPEHRHHTDLTVEFLDGSRETETVIARAPVSNEKIIAKYDRLSHAAISFDQAEELKNQVLHMEDLDDARTLSRLLLGSKSL
jgi:2-methylcitrate dehydratase PrpD